jgi:hypothetical protein
MTLEDVCTVPAGDDWALLLPSAVVEVGDYLYPLANQFGATGIQPLPFPTM